MPFLLASSPALLPLRSLSRQRNAVQCILYLAECKCEWSVHSAATSVYLLTARLLSPLPVPVSFAQLLKAVASGFVSLTFVRRGSASMAS